MFLLAIGGRAWPAQASGAFCTTVLSHSAVWAIRAGIRSYVVSEVSQGRLESVSPGELPYEELQREYSRLNPNVEDFNFTAYRFREFASLQNAMMQIVPFEGENTLRRFLKFMSMGSFLTLAIYDVTFLKSFGELDWSTYPEWAAFTYFLKAAGLNAIFGIAAWASIQIENQASDNLKAYRQILDQVGETLENANSDEWGSFSITIARQEAKFLESIKRQPKGAELEVARLDILARLNPFTRRAEYFLIPRVMPSPAPR